VAFLLMPLTIAGCSAFESDQLKRCEEWTLKQVKSPGTYKRAEVEETPGNDISYVSIKFDSENGFGALIRSNAICAFRGKSTEIDEKRSAMIDGSGPLGELAR
jgi:hypothetical protein